MPTGKAKRKKHPGGRPKGKTKPFTLVVFSADENVIAAINRLTAVVLSMSGIAPGFARPIAIRRALLEAAARIETDKYKPPMPEEK